MGSGRTGDQDQGGMGVGGDSGMGGSSGGYGGSSGGMGGTSGGYDDGSGSGGKKDSTMGKLMEKAGGMMKNDGLAEKGRQKRDEAGGGGYGNDSSTGNY